MTRHLLLLSFLSIISFSCETEKIDSTEQQTEEPITETFLLKKIIFDKGTDDEYTEIYNYENNKLTSVDYGDGYKNIYSYDNNDHLIKDEYNTDGKISMYIETFLESSGLSDRKYKHLLTHNSDNTITDELYISFSDAAYQLVTTNTITLTGNNISKIEDGDYSATLTYDDKNGMFKNVHAIEILNILSENEFGAIIYGNTNNITSYLEDDSSISDNYYETFEYTYDENNYPTYCTNLSTYGSVEETYTMNFYYE